MKRYVIRALMERSSEVVSVLTAASMAVSNGHPSGPFDARVEVHDDSPGEAASKVTAALTLPPEAEPLTITVNAPTGEEALAKVREALGPWGDVPVELLGEEPL